MYPDRFEVHTILPKLHARLSQECLHLFELIARLEHHRDTPMSLHLTLPRTSRFKFVVRADGNDSVEPPRPDFYCEGRAVIRIQGEKHRDLDCIRVQHFILPGTGSVLVKSSGEIAEEANGGPAAQVCRRGLVFISISLKSKISSDLTFVNTKLHDASRSVATGLDLRRRYETKVRQCGT
jgi:hypothetical protein